MIDQTVLVYIWAGILSLVLTLYVMLDGFDLGIGVLSLFVREADQRETMMGSIGAIWDANETWLVLAGGILFGAFPVAYAVLLNALYIPIMIMLFGLIFRAVSFEFISHSRRKSIWQFAFGLGSLVAVMGQGFTLGGVLSDIRVAAGEFIGGPWDWLNASSIVMTAAVGVGYLVLGASYLLAHGRGTLHQHMHRVTVICSVLLFVAVAAMTVLVPMLFERISEKWSSQSIGYLLIAMSLCVVVAFMILILVTVYQKHTWWPFAASLALFGLSFSGLLVAIHPYIVPTSITITEAAAGTDTLTFMLFGIGLLIPIMLGYNLYLYRVFHIVITEAHD